MGQTPSTPAAAPSTVASPSTATEVGGTKLFKWVASGSGGSWEVQSANASYSFYDQNQDSNTEARQWALEVADLEAPVTDSFSCEQPARRVTVRTGDTIIALRFATVAAYHDFVREYNDKLFENTYGVPNEERHRDKVFGKDSVLQLGPETDESRQAWTADMDVEEAPAPGELAPKPDRKVADKDAIHGVRLGAGDRSYLVRDRQIDVLKNVYGGVQDTGLSFNVTPPRGGAFTPSKLLLTKRETRMNMLTPEKGETMFHTDIETGKVVSEWAFQKDGVDVAMKDIVNETRAAQLDNRDTFLGLGSNRLVRWDMRDPSGVVQDMASPSVVSYAGGKDYARNTGFNCMATSGDGFVVVGSDDGQVRLYSDKTLTRASTAIPGLGAAITAVDVTYDGKWVLATTKNYLMVVKTTFKDSKSGKDSNGFRNRMGRQAPAPRLLRLKMEDEARVGSAPLQKGKFTWVTESGRQERWIVASCGNYTVLWNFRQVKLAQPDVVSYGGLTTCTDYHLIPKQESVVDSVFMHDNYATNPGADESSMVVVTQHQIWSLADD